MKGGSITARGVAALRVPPLSLTNRGSLRWLNFSSIGVPVTVLPGSSWSRGPESRDSTWTDPRLHQHVDANDAYNWEN